MRLLGALLCLSGSLVSFSAAAQQGRADIVRPDMPGRALFAEHCAACHGTGSGDDGARLLPGTAVLQEKYEGARPGEIELRNDLPAPVLRVFVRRGTGSMPMFRPSELTDAEIDEIADYLAASAAANGDIVR